jgi:hypothetical protein
MSCRIRRFVLDINRFLIFSSFKKMSEKKNLPINLIKNDQSSASNQQQVITYSRSVIKLIDIFLANECRLTNLSSNEMKDI